MKKTLLAWLSALLLTCLSTTHATAQPPSFVQSNGAISHWPVFGAVATTFTSYGGSQGNTWEVGGPTGPLWNNNAGAFESRNATNNAFAIVRGATPVAANDLVTKAYADARAPSAIAGAMFVYQQGGTASPGVFTSFAGAASAASAVNGPVTIVVDATLGTPVVPSGTYTFPNSVLTLAGVTSAFGNVVQESTVLTFQQGAVLVPPLNFYAREIQLVSASTNFVFTTSSGSGLANYPYVALQNQSCIRSNSGAAPFIHVPSTGSLVFDIDRRSALGDGTNTAMQHDGSGVTYNLSRSSFLAASSVTGSGLVPGGVAVHVDATSFSSVSALSAFVSLDAVAVRTLYSDTVTPTLGSTTVQGAIDALKPKVLPTTGSNGTVLTVVSGAPAWANFPASTQPGTTLICAPGGSAGPNVFTSWPPLMAAANAIVGPVTIGVSGTCHVTAGTWTFNNGNVSFIGVVAAFADVLLFDNGAQITEPTTQDTFYYVENLFLESQSSSPAFPIPDGSAGFVNFNVYDNGFFGTSFFFSATAPFVQSGAAGTTQIRCFIRNGRIGGGQPAFDLTTSTTSAKNPFVLLDRSLIVNNGVLDPNNRLTVEVDSPSANWGNVPLANVTLATKASALGYSDTVTPTLGATQVQAAIDALKLKVLPTTGSNGQVLTVVSGAPAWAAAGGGGGITALTNDVTASGTGSVAAQVNSASGTSPFAFKPTLFQWLQGTTSPEITQAAAAASTNGQVLEVQAQNGGSGATTGGSALLIGGTGGSTAGSASLLAGDSSYGVAATPFGISFGGTTGSRASWTAGIAVPILTQDTSVSGAGRTLTVQAQQGAASTNGGQLNLLGGAPGSGGLNGGVFMGTQDAANLVSATSASVDLLSAHNYRIGNWASTFGTGVGEVLLKDDSSQPGSLVSGGLSFGSHIGNFTLNAPSFAFRPFITDPTILQEQAAASTSGQTMTLAAQPGGTGNTNGGSLNLQSGPHQGTGVDGPVALTTGNGSNQIALWPGASGAFSRFSFSGPVSQPLFTQENAASSTNGVTLTVRAQTGGAGSTNGGNLLLNGGIMGSSGTGANGFVIIQSVDQSNTIEVGDDLFALNHTSPTAITAGNATSQSSVGLNYMPAITYSAGQRFTQIVSEEKFVDVCHIVAPSSSSGNCETGIPMQVQGQMHVHFVTQCRVTTAGSGTTVNDNVTSDGFGDWVNTTGGSGAPTPNETAIYGQVSSGTPGVFNPIVYTFGGATTGGHGFAAVPFVVSTASGRNLGTLDCTTWADDKFN